MRERNMVLPRQEFSRQTNDRKKHGFTQVKVQRQTNDKETWFYLGQGPVAACPKEPHTNTEPSSSAAEHWHQDANLKLQTTSCMNF